jgi:hypothetical protein
MLCAYCIGNAAAPFMWQQKYKPRHAKSPSQTIFEAKDSRNLITRNHVPWIIIGICYVSCMAIVMIIRFLLDRENKMRDMEKHDDTYDDVYIERMGPEGKMEQVKVDKASFWFCHHQLSLLSTPLTEVDSYYRNSWISPTDRTGTLDMCCDDGFF